MRFKILELKQNSNELFTAVIPFNYINKNSHVLVYGKDEGGYQREPDSKHYNKIKNYVTENSNFLFPTSIILGIDNDDYAKIISKELGQLFINLELETSKEIFRIIDGQHRLKGIESALDYDDRLNNLPLSIVVLRTETGKRSKEMQIFNTINSKSKRIKVDLIKLAEYDYRLIEENIGVKQLSDHICIKVANLLNDDESDNNVWQNTIKFGIHDDEKIGIIGVNAFMQSIQPIVNEYISEFKYLKEKSPEEIILFANSSAKEIKRLLDNAWMVVRDKWGECFHTKKQVVQIDGEPVLYYYDKHYYIQKTLGTKSINYTLGEVIKNSDYNVLEDENLNQFRRIIESSKIYNKDWKIGVTFSGYSSESAFNKVKRMIMGQTEVPRN